MAPTETWEYLKRVGIFSDLSTESLQDLAVRMKARSFAAGSIIVGQEDRGDSMYVVAEGRVKVVLYGDNGREIILSMFRGGEIFGEMSLLDNRPRSASVIAIEPTRVLVLERSEFTGHLDSHPQTALAVLAELSQRLRQADRVIGNLALLDVYGRVARMLKDLADQDGVVTEEGVLIRMRPTQQEIASMIGTSRETVSRALNDFAKRGLLSMSGKQIVLHSAFIEEGLEAA